MSVVCRHSVSGAWKRFLDGQREQETQGLDQLSMMMK